MSSTRISRGIAALICAVGSLALAAGAHATSITVINPSFETLPGGGLPVSCGTGCSYNVGAIPGWSNSGTTGQFQPGEPTNTTFFNVTASDGTPTVAFTDAGTISQTVGATVQTGDVYTLMVDIGFRKIAAFDGTVDLLINGVRYVATGSAPSQGNWSTYTATYTGLAADAGKSITIELGTTGIEGDFDDVRLSDNALAATPEPGSLVLLGSGLLGLAGFVRRRFTR